MLKDKDGNRIIPLPGDNGQTLITGKSGKGKTYLIYRLLEESLHEGKRILVIDQSESFSLYEIENANFTAECMDYIDFEEGNFTFFLQCKDKRSMKNWIVDSVIKSFDIGDSPMQREILEISVERVVAQNDSFSFHTLYMEIENYSKENTRKELTRQAGLLLRKIQCAKQMKHIIVKKEDDIWVEKTKGVTVFQVSELKAELRRKLVLFLLSLLFEESKVRASVSRYNQIVLDEFQDYPIHDSVLEEFLRKGRKFHIELILSTQYISDLRKPDKNALMQQSTMYIFQPVEEDTKTVAETLAMKSQNKISSKTWREVLYALQRGEAIYVGKYHLKGKKRELQRPIKVKVEKQKN